MLRKILKQIKFIVEFLLLVMLLVIFKIIGYRASSYLAGIITKIIGKRHRAHRIAHGNMVRAMPEIKAKERGEMLDRMWMSLGRIIGEYIFISRMKKKDLDKIIKIDENSLKNVQKMKERSNDEKNPKGGIIFSGHLGNWDVGLRYLMVNGVKVNALYRALNNKYVDDLMCAIKEFKPIHKGREGLREVIVHIKRGEYVIILADQRVADGEKVDFFHEEALTTTSIARIALKYDVDIIPARSYRDKDEKTNFVIEVGDPLDTKGKDEVTIMKKVNEILERWIKQTPAQWFWVHNRWK